MQKTAFLFSACVFAALSSCTAAGDSNSAQAPATQPAIVKGEVTQPAASSKSWEFRELALPKLSDVVHNARPNPYIYGLYLWAGEYKSLEDSIHKVGWRSFRSGGPFTDDTMRLYAKSDIEVMTTLAPEKGGPKPDVADLDHSPYVEQYAKQVAEFVGRYGPGGTFFKENPSVPNRPIRDIEICNEPNFQYLIPPDGRPGPALEADREALYAKLLPAAYKAAKAANPKIEVVGFGAGGSGAGDMRFIQHVHEKNPAVAKSYDILSTHPYVEPAPPEAWSIHSWGGYSVVTSLKTIRSILEHFNRANAPIWYTECGWPISQADGGHFAMKGEQVSPMFQAADVCRMYALSQRLGVDRVHIMFATDTDNFNAGFFTREGAWRPSAYAVQTMIHLMPAPKLLGAISDGSGGTFIYSFSPGNPNNAKPVIMAWNVSGPKTVDIPFKEKRATLTDMLGHSQQLTAGNHMLRAEIGPFPIYIQASQ